MISNILTMVGIAQNLAFSFVTNYLALNYVYSVSKITQCMTPQTSLCYVSSCFSNACEHREKEREKKDVHMLGHTIFCEVSLLAHKPLKRFIKA